MGKNFEDVKQENFFEFFSCTGTLINTASSSAMPLAMAVRRSNHLDTMDRYFCCKLEGNFNTWLRNRILNTVPATPWIWILSGSGYVTLVTGTVPLPLHYLADIFPHLPQSATLQSRIIAQHLPERERLVLV